MSEVDIVDDETIAAMQDEIDSLKDRTDALETEDSDALTDIKDRLDEIEQYDLGAIESDTQDNAADLESLQDKFDELRSEYDDFVKDVRDFMSNAAFHANKVDAAEADADSEAVTIEFMPTSDPDADSQR